MKIILQSSEKPYAIIGEAGTVIRAFYSREDARGYMDWLKKQNWKDEKTEIEFQDGEN